MKKFFAILGTALATIICAFIVVGTRITAPLIPIKSEAEVVEEPAVEAVVEETDATEDDVVVEDSEEGEEEPEEVVDPEVEEPAEGGDEVVEEPAEEGEATVEEPVDAEPVEGEAAEEATEEEIAKKPLDEFIYNSFGVEKGSDLAKIIDYSFAGGLFLFSFLFGFVIAKPFKKKAKRQTTGKRAKGSRANFTVPTEQTKPDVRF